jgi:prevent-host-death family protein
VVALLTDFQFRFEGHIASREKVPLSVVTIRDLSRNPSAVVDEVERSSPPALVTRTGKPIAALVRIDPEALEDWLLSTVDDPLIGVSLEESPATLRAAATVIPYGKRQIQGLTKAEAEAFSAALAE